VNPNKSLKDELAQLQDNLKSGAVELVDFDRAIELLKDAVQAFEENDNTAAELAFMKHEYRRRIAGMLKAVMVGRAKEGDAELAAALADDDSPIGGRDLIELHRRISARFRDCFPASFKYSTPPGSPCSRKNWMDHKL
jgi:hypothetical protein